MPVVGGGVGGGVGVWRGGEATEIQVQPCFTFFIKFTCFSDPCPQVEIRNQCLML